MPKRRVDSASFCFKHSSAISVFQWLNRQLLSVSINYNKFPTGFPPCYLWLPDCDCLSPLRIVDPFFWKAHGRPDQTWIPSPFEENTPCDQVIRTPQNSHLEPKRITQWKSGIWTIHQTMTLGSKCPSFFTGFFCLEGDLLVPLSQG